ncbi:MAG: phage major capsid protein [Hyphomicrobiales bacterium]|nr:phage major capsid protein [Hyphomicrobiales bacterium]
MPKLQDLKEQRAAKIVEMRTINDKAMNDKRDLDDGERKSFDALDKETRSLGDQIDRAEKLAAYERLEASGETVSGTGEMRRELRNYSLAKAATESLAGKLSGVEAEFHQELSKGRETRGLMVPVDILLGGGAETRAITTTTPASYVGGNLIRTDLAAMTDRRRPALKVEALGATVLRGLVGNLDLPRLNSSGTAYWIAEHAATTGSDAKFEKKSMSPNTVSGQYELSRRMVLQSNEAIETILRRDLGLILAQALDRAALRGGGTNEPTGITADTDVTELTAAAFSSDATADMIAALETDDVTGTTAFLMHPNIMKIVRKEKDTDGRVIPASELFHSKPFDVSTQVPDDGASPATDQLIYGEWASLYLGYWSGVDILMNPYADSVASKGGVLLHAFLDADVVVRHPEGFTYMGITG